MNISRYNIIEEFCGEDGKLEYLLFNSLHGSFASLDADAFEAYKRIDKSAAFFEDFCAQGFFTELSPEEELNVQRSRFEHARKSADEFAVCIAPTYACTCDCPYCYERFHDFPKGIMRDEIYDALLAFIKRRFECELFKKLSIQWYGGEPTLGLAGMLRFSSAAYNWCEENSIPYEGLILTNCNTVGEEEVKALKDAHVGAALITLDGPRDVHNIRRPAKDGGDSYERTMNTARLMQEASIQVNFIMNSDKTNFHYYQQMRDEFRKSYGIEYELTKCVDYDDKFGTEPFVKPGFELFEQEEFAQTYCDMFVGEGHSPQEYRALLSPISHFCHGQTENYYVVDVRGDVYKCDGYMGNKDYVRFNLLDCEQAGDSSSSNSVAFPEDTHVHEVFVDPTCDERCAPCELLPVCMGTCFWERECVARQKHRRGQMPCGALKTAIGGYLQGYRKSSGNIDKTAGFVILANAFTEEEIL